MVANYADHFVFGALYQHNISPEGQIVDLSITKNLPVHA